MTRAYLFDFNGVLVDDEWVHFAAMRDVVAPRGATLDEHAYLERYFAFDDRAAFRAIFRDAGVPCDEPTLAACVAEKLQRYLRAIDEKLVVFDGGFALLRACARRAPVAIVSGALRVEIETVLAREGAGAAVTTIVSADDVDACKPDPAGYTEAMRRLGVGAADVVVVEDSLGGVAAARAAGCAVVAVAHSFPRERFAGCGAALVVDRIGELDVDRLDAARSAKAPA